jgi:hypothetical protein
MLAREPPAQTDSSLRMDNASKLSAKADSSDKVINAPDSPAQPIRRLSELPALTDVVQKPNGMDKPVRSLLVMLDSSSKTEPVSHYVVCTRDLMPKRRSALEFHAELVSRKSTEDAKRSNANQTRLEEEMTASSPDVPLKDKFLLTENAFSLSALLVSKLLLETELRFASPLTAHLLRDSSETSVAELSVRLTSATTPMVFVSELPAQPTRS